jgi:hypothetical protein
MADMEKSWEQKLAEAKTAEDERKAKREAEEAARQSGTPHLVNLNEDPMLDRKVLYDIPTEGITCGRRKKGSEHKIQLSGTGIKDNHLKLIQTEDGNAQLIPLDESALSQITINGKKMSAMDPYTLKPNDRICIGPSAIFLFKNRNKEDDSCTKDTAEEPITFDFASDEVYVSENSEEEAKKAKAAEEMESAH